MAKKKKKSDGLTNFEIQYSNASGSHTGTQRAIDKHDAILKFKQLNPGVRIKDAKEIPNPNIGRGMSSPTLIIDDRPIDAISDGNKRLYPYDQQIDPQYRSDIPPTIPPVMILTGKKPYNGQIEIQKDEI